MKKLLCNRKCLWIQELLTERPPLLCTDTRVWWEVCLNVTESKREVTEPVSDSILFLCPKPDRHRFKLKHWVCVTQLRSHMRGVKFTSKGIALTHKAKQKTTVRHCDINHKPQTMTRKESMICVRFTLHFDRKMAESDPNWNIISKYLFKTGPTCRVLAGRG